MVRRFSPLLQRQIVGAGEAQILGRGDQMCGWEFVRHHLRAAVAAGVIDHNDRHGQPVGALLRRLIDALQAAAQQIAHVIGDDNYG